MTAAAKRETAHAAGFRVQGLELFLSRTVTGFRGPVVVRQIGDDPASETHVITTPAARFILRVKPSVPPAPHIQPFEREFRILATLHAKDYPTPRPLIYSDDTAIIGTPFYVTTCIEGRVYERASLPGTAAAERTAIYDAMNETLARLHAYDPQALGLSGLSRSGGYLAGQVELWGRHYLAVRRDDMPEMDRLLAWLPDHLPAERPQRLVHGDYGIGKLVIASDETKVAAVMGWEQASLGDPIADAVNHALNWIVPPADGSASLSRLDLADLGIPSMDRYLTAYAARSGLGEIPHLNNYLAYNLFRQAALQLALDDPEQPTRARSLAKFGWAFAQRASAKN